MDYPMTNNSKVLLKEEKNSNSKVMCFSMDGWEKDIHFFELLGLLLFIAGRTLLSICTVCSGSPPVQTIGSALF